jgi:hypothetical protein
MDDNKIKKADLNKQAPLGVSQPRAGRAGGPKGTGFTNIQSVIKANQGNKLGQAVAGGVQQQGQQVRAGVQQAGQKFGQQVQANRLGEQDQAQAQGLVTKAAGLQAGQDLSEQELTAAQKYAQGAYQGPQDIENSAQLAGQAAEAEQLGRLGGSAAGRQGLLQRFVGAPQYSFGQQKLDNLLLGANQGALSQARASTRGVADQTISAIEAARGQAQEAAAGNQKFASLFKKNAEDTQGGITSTRDQALKAAQDKEAASSAAYDAFSKNLSGLYGASNGYRTGQDNAGTMIDSFQGLDPAAKEKLKSVVTQAGALGVDPRAAIGGILKQYQGAQGLDDASAFTTKDQAARINALSKLAGKETQDFSKAGSFKEGGGGINEEQADKSASSLQQIKSKNQAIQDAGQTHLKAMQSPGSLDQVGIRTYLGEEGQKAYNQAMAQANSPFGSLMDKQFALQRVKQFQEAIQNSAKAKTQATQSSFDAQKQALVNSFLSRGY